jgi:hypothetical protein
MDPSARVNFNGLNGLAVNSCDQDLYRFINMKKKQEKTQTTDPKMGRPKLEFNFEIFEGLCRIQCTLPEIASVMQVSEDTVERRCKEHYGETYAETFKKYSAGGKMRLRRAQFKIAEGGNVPMLIWLGKNYLGQTERVEYVGKIDVTQCSDDELRKIIDSEGKG